MARSRREGKIVCTLQTVRASAFMSQKLFARAGGCKNFPLNQFDQHAKFGCSFSYCVRACRRSKNLGMRGPAPWYVAWLTARKTPSPHGLHMVAQGQTLRSYVGLRRSAGKHGHSRPAVQGLSKSLESTRFHRLPMTSY